ncbi:MAG: hypothetical protein JO001_02620 [Alphaproteobacteria bacterium]|nr:hypothetical protein [Alphaproteobacteria bacterium]
MPINRKLRKLTEDGVASSNTEPLGDKLLLEEFKILRGEIELRASEQRGMERNVILIAAAIYGFLLTPKGTIQVFDAPFSDLAWYLPPVFSFLALVRWKESVKMIEALAAYLMTVEERILPAGGWEVFLEKQRRKDHLPITSGWYAVFWIATVVGPLVVAYVRHPASIKDVTETAILIGVLASVAVGLFVVRTWKPAKEET